MQFFAANNIDAENINVLISAMGVHAYSLMRYLLEKSRNTPVFKVFVDFFEDSLWSKAMLDHAKV